ncbi:hypothetical protein Pth03_18190 [Planotetraspora thailandica]|uniref:TIGR00374 family protein n=1 Tax=Planotetraspora thailandica TaxID=487172 RepID=A0A8J3VAV7_9ACTN|nr:YbhN family protein [Planotetraspora thailandica]GII53430.1 hypothetical protein Pth03_18190 [Planotetraspora thailandica]
MPRWLRATLVVGAIGLAVFVLKGSLPDVDDVWGAMSGLQPAWLTVGIVAEIMSMNTFARLIRRLLTIGGTRVTFPRAVAVTYARNAVSNSLPAGQVVSIAYTTRQFARLGAATPLIAATLVLSALYSTAAFAVLGVVAVLGEPSIRTVALFTLTAVALTVVVLVKVRPRGLAQRLGRRFPSMVGQLRSAREAVRLARRDQLILATLAMANWLLDIACLAAVCAATGVHVRPQTVLLGYVAAKAAAVLLLIPGGLGIAEVGLAATLIGAGVGGGAAAAVVLLYRLISYWGVLLIGWAAWLLLLDGIRAHAVRAAQWVWGVYVQWGVSMNPCTLYGYRDLPH